MSDDLSDFSLMDLFRTEAETNTALISNGLLALEEGAGRNSALIEPLMRAAHSLKGAARIVGLDAAVTVAHAMEDCFVAVQEGKCRLDPKGVDVMLRAVDLLSTISQQEEDRFIHWYIENEATIDAIVAEIHAIMTAVPLPPLPAPASTGVEQTAASHVIEPEENVADEVAVARAEETFFDKPPSFAPEKPATAVVSAVETTPIPAEAEQPDRVVRVTAESLTRLMSLAGESLVQSRQLRPFVQLAARAQDSTIRAPDHTPGSSRPPQRSRSRSPRSDSGERVLAVARGQGRGI